ncbi:transforming acidic coiled-coil-containing protein 3-like isoform X6 [Ptychodera flava]|uniref:transforming acidic coiled-coil-containing protein 3-like isoform X6 n=1 Tax=Ptychodera flava TaxID=63121 RepID=UPI00396A879A
MSFSFSVSLLDENTEPDKGFSLNSEKNFQRRSSQPLQSILKPSQKNNLQHSYSPRKRPKQQVSIQTPSSQSAVSRVVDPSAWAALRELDENERWAERCQVVTKQDHLDYIQYATEFVEDIFQSVPISDTKTDSVVAAEVGKTATPTSEVTTAQAAPGGESHTVEADTKKDTLPQEEVPSNGSLIESAIIGGEKPTSLPTTDPESQPKAKEEIQVLHVTQESEAELKQEPASESPLQKILLLDFSPCKQDQLTQRPVSSDRQHEIPLLDFSPATPYNPEGETTSSEGTPPEDSKEKHFAFGEEKADGQVSEPNQGKEEVVEEKDKEEIIPEPHPAVETQEEPAQVFKPEEVQKPVIEESAPAESGVTEEVRNEKPEQEEPVLTSTGPAETPTAPEEKPSGTEQTPTVPEETPTVPEETPTVPEETPTVPEEKPTVPEETPTVPEETPTVPEETPTVPEETPSVPEETPTVPEETPTVPEEKPTVPEETPPVPEEKPTVPEETPSVPEEKPTVPEEKSTVPEDSKQDCPISKPEAESEAPGDQQVAPTQEDSVVNLDVGQEEARKAESLGTETEGEAKESEDLASTQAPARNTTAKPLQRLLSVASAADLAEFEKQEKEIEQQAALAQLLETKQEEEELKRESSENTQQGDTQKVTGVDDIPAAPVGESDIGEPVQKENTEPASETELKNPAKIPMSEDLNGLTEVAAEVTEIQPEPATLEAEETVTLEDSKEANSQSLPTEDKKEKPRRKLPEKPWLKKGKAKGKAVEEDIEIFAAPPPPKTSGDQPKGVAPAQSSDLDDIPIKLSAPKGKSIYDMDETDFGDPFGSSNKMSNSPTPATAVGYNFENVTDPFSSSNKTSSSPRNNNGDTFKIPANNDIDADDITSNDKEDYDEFKPASEDITPDLAELYKTEYHKWIALIDFTADPALPEPMFIMDEDFRPAGEGAAGLERDLSQLSFEEMEARLAEEGSDEEEEFFLASEAFNPADPNAFDIDYLEKAGGSSTFKESALARQSLYVKFDPLVEGGSPKGVQRGTAAKAGLPSLGEVSMEGEDLLQMSTPPGNRTALHQNHLLNSVKKAEERVPTPDKGVDKLLQFSPSGEAMVTETDAPKRTQSTDSPDGDAGIVQPLLYTQLDLNEALKRAREDFMRERGTKMDKKEGEQKRLTKEFEEMQQHNLEMRTIVSEYEKTIQQMIEDSDKGKTVSKEALTEMQRERDQALEDMSSVESAFSDLHRRYEKLKTAVEGYKKNEEILKKCVADYQAKLKKQEQRYQTLKSHAEEKIESANLEIEKVRKANAAEIAGLQAGLKREQMKVQSLEKTVDQKTKENQELTSICDELIAKMQ